MFALLIIGCDGATQTPQPDDEPSNGNGTPLSITTTTATHLEETPDAFTVTKHETNIPGPTVFIIGGIHGNERAGWMVADDIAKTAEGITRGTVYVLPFANPQSVDGEASTRNAPGRGDLNRVFPGNPNGSQLEQLAHAIYRAVRDANPDMVLDLHEARGCYSEGNMGNSVIMHHEGYRLYLLDVLDNFNNSDLMQNTMAFTYLHAPPEGSFNRVITELLEIPVFTTETNRMSTSGSIASELQPLEDRIAQQRALIQRFLDTFEKRD